MDKDGYTAIIECCTNGDVELCKYLIEKGADIKVKAGDKTLL